MKNLFLNSKKVVVLMALVIGFISMMPSSARAENFVIIVNAANAGPADISEIKNLYLKKKTAWPNGAEAVPLGRPADSAEHIAFLGKVLGFSSQGDLDAYWQTEKSKSGLTGPREVGSDNILIRQVERKEGAFGILKKSEVGTLPETVKVLLAF